MPAVLMAPLWFTVTVAPLDAAAPVPPIPARFNPSAEPAAPPGAPTLCAQMPAAPAPVASQAQVEARQVRLKTEFWEGTVSNQGAVLTEWTMTRFTDGKSISCDLRAQVRQTANNQSPFAAIVGCIDSRVAPELVFDQRIGDVFCVRVAGNIVNTDIIGSLEYSTKVAGAKAIVVLGHNSCGAIKSAVDDVKLGNITKKRRFVAVRHRVGYGGIAVMDLFAKPGSLGSGPAF